MSKFLTSLSCPKCGHKWQQHNMAAEKNSRLAEENRRLKEEVEGLSAIVERCKELLRSWVVEVEGTMCYDTMKAKRLAAAIEGGEKDQPKEPKP